LPILKAEARSAVIANCLALQQHFAVIYRFPLCLMVGGWVAGRLVGWENAVGKILWKFGVEYCVCVNCHLLLSTFGANICARLLFDCRLLVITFCRLILLFTMANLHSSWPNAFSIISAVRWLYGNTRQLVCHLNSPASFIIFKVIFALMRLTSKVRFSLLTLSIYFIILFKTFFSPVLLPNIEINNQKLFKQLPMIKPFNS